MGIINLLQFSRPAVIFMNFVYKQPFTTFSHKLVSCIHKGMGGEITVICRYVESLLLICLCHLLDSLQYHC